MDNILKKLLTTYNSRIELALSACPERSRREVEVRSKWRILLIISIALSSFLFISPASAAPSVRPETADVLTAIPGKETITLSPYGSAYLFYADKSRAGFYSENWPDIPGVFIEPGKKRTLITSPALGNFDYDNALEIVFISEEDLAGSEKYQLHVFNHAGQNTYIPLSKHGDQDSYFELPTKPAGYIKVVDLNSDGTDEIIVPSFDGRVFIYSGSNILGSDIRFKKYEVPGLTADYSYNYSTKTYEGNSSPYGSTRFIETALINQDSYPDIVAVDGSGKVTTWLTGLDQNGTLTYTSSFFELGAGVAVSPGLAGKDTIIQKMNDGTVRTAPSVSLMAIGTGNGVVHQFKFVNNSWEQVSTVQLANMIESAPFFVDLNNNLDDGINLIVAGENNKIFDFNIAPDGTAADALVLKKNSKMMGNYAFSVRPSFNSFTELYTAVDGTRFDSLYFNEFNEIVNSVDGSFYHESQPQLIRVKQRYNLFSSAGDNIFNPEGNGNGASDYQDHLVTEAGIPYSVDNNGTPLYNVMTIIDYPKDDNPADSLYPVVSGIVPIRGCALGPNPANSLLPVVKADLDSFKLFYASGILSTTLHPGEVADPLNFQGAGKSTLTWKPLEINKDFTSSDPMKGIIPAVNANLAFFDTQELSEGPYTLLLVVKDKSGNCGSDTRIVTVNQTTAPVAEVFPIEYYICSKTPVDLAVDILTESGSEVASLYHGPFQMLPPPDDNYGKGTSTWDGKGSAEFNGGNIVPDGVYTVRFNIDGQSGKQDSLTYNLKIDSQKPSLVANSISVENGTTGLNKVTTVKQDVLIAIGMNDATLPSQSDTIRVANYKNAKLFFENETTHQKFVFQTLLYRNKDGYINQVFWNAKEQGSGAEVPDGTYIYSVEVTDLVGNISKYSFAELEGNGAKRVIVDRAAIPVLSFLPQPVIFNNDTGNTLKLNFKINESVPGLTLEMLDRRGKLIASKDLASNAPYDNTTLANFPSDFNALTWDTFTGSENYWSTAVDGEYKFRLKTCDDAMLFSPSRGQIANDSIPLGNQYEAQIVAIKNRVPVLISYPQDQGTNHAHVTGTISINGTAVDPNWDTMNDFKYFKLYYIKGTVKPEEITDAEARDPSTHNGESWIPLPVKEFSRNYHVVPPVGDAQYFGMNTVLDGMLTLFDTSSLEQGQAYTLLLTTSDEHYVNYDVRTFIPDSAADPVQTSPVIKLINPLDNSPYIFSTKDAVFTIGYELTKPALAGARIEFEVFEKLQDNSPGNVVYRNIIEPSILGNGETITSEVAWDGKDTAGKYVTSGNYFFRLTAIDEDNNGMKLSGNGETIRTQFEKSIVIENMGKMKIEKLFVLSTSGDIIISKSQEAISFALNLSKPAYVSAGADLNKNGVLDAGEYFTGWAPADKNLQNGIYGFVDSDIVITWPDSPINEINAFNIIVEAVNQYDPNDKAMAGLTIFKADPSDKVDSSLAWISVNNISMGSFTADYGSQAQGGCNFNWSASATGYYDPEKTFNMTMHVSSPGNQTQELGQLVPTFPWMDYKAKVYKRGILQSKIGKWNRMVIPADAFNFDFSVDYQNFFPTNYPHMSYQVGQLTPSYNGCNPILNYVFTNYSKSDIEIGMSNRPYLIAARSNFGGSGWGNPPPPQPYTIMDSWFSNTSPSIFNANAFSSFTVEEYITRHYTAKSYNLMLASPHDASLEGKAKFFILDRNNNVIYENSSLEYHMNIFAYKEVYHFVIITQGEDVELGILSHQHQWWENSSGQVVTDFYNNRFFLNLYFQGGDISQFNPNSFNSTRFYPFSDYKPPVWPWPKDFDKPEFSTYLPTEQVVLGASTQNKFQSNWRDVNYIEPDKFSRIDLQKITTNLPAPDQLESVFYPIQIEAAQDVAGNKVYTNCAQSLSYNKNDIITNGDITQPDNFEDKHFFYDVNPPAQNRWKTYFPELAENNVFKQRANNADFTQTIRPLYKEAVYGDQKIFSAVRMDYPLKITSTYPAEMYEQSVSSRLLPGAYPNNNKRPIAYPQYLYYDDSTLTGTEGSDIPPSTRSMLMPFSPSNAAPALVNPLVSTMLRDENVQTLYTNAFNGTSETITFQFTKPFYLSKLVVKHASSAQEHSSLENTSDYKFACINGVTSFTCVSISNNTQPINIFDLTGEKCSNSLQLIITKPDHKSSDHKIRIAEIEIYGSGSLSEQNIAIPSTGLPNYLAKVSGVKASTRYDYNVLNGMQIDYNQNLGLDQRNHIVPLENMWKKPWYKTIDLKTRADIVPAQYFGVSQSAPRVLSKQKFQFTANPSDNVEFHLDHYKLGSGGNNDEVVRIEELPAQSSISPNESPEEFYVRASVTVPAPAQLSDKCHAENIAFNNIPWDGAKVLKDTFIVTNKKYSSVSGDIPPFKIQNDLNDQQLFFYTGYSPLAGQANLSQNSLFLRNDPGNIQGWGYYPCNNEYGVCGKVVDNPGVVVGTSTNSGWVVSLTYPDGSEQNIFESKVIDACASGSTVPLKGNEVDDRFSVNLKKWDRNNTEPARIFVKIKGQQTFSSSFIGVNTFYRSISENSWHLISKNSLKTNIDNTQNPAKMNLSLFWDVTDLVGDYEIKLVELFSSSYDEKIITPIHLGKYINTAFDYNNMSLSQAKSNTALCAPLNRAVLELGKFTADNANRITDSAFAINSSARMALSLQDPADLSLDPGTSIPVFGPVVKIIPEDTVLNPNALTLSVNYTAEELGSRTAEDLTGYIIDNDGKLKPINNITIEGDNEKKTVVFHFGSQPFQMKSAFTVDNVTPPVLAYNTNRTKSQAYLVSGQAQQNVQIVIKINNKEELVCLADHRGRFSLSIPLNEGSNTIIAKARRSILNKDNVIVQDSVWSLPLLVECDSQSPQIVVTAFSNAFSPNGDGIKDTADFLCSVNELLCSLNISIKNSSDNIVYTNAAQWSDTQKDGKISFHGLDVNGNTLPTGRYIVNLTAIDSFGNVSKPWEHEIILDKIAPNTVLKTSGQIFLTSDQVCYVASSAQLSLYASDSGSAVERTEFHFGTDASSIYQSEIPLDFATSSTLHFYSIDIAGNKEQEKSILIIKDLIPPSASLAFIGNYFNDGSRNYYIGPQTGIKISNSSPVPEFSGVKSASYSISGNAWVEVPEKFFLPEIASLPEGIYHLNFRVDDRVGNRSPMQSCEISMDRTSPKLEIVYHKPFVDSIIAGVSVRFISGNENISFSAEDTLSSGISSGMGEVQYQIDNSNWVAILVGECISVPEGRHVVKCRAYDRTGNVSESSVDLMIDQSAPVVNVQNGDPQSTQDNSIFIRSDTPISFSADDSNGAGVASIFTRIDGGKWTEKRYDAAELPIVKFQGYADGIHTLEYYAMDSISNKSVVVSLSYKIDSEPPFTVFAPFKAPGVMEEIYVDPVSGFAYAAPSYTFKFISDDIPVNNVSSGLKEIRYSRSLSSFEGTGLTIIPKNEMTNTSISFNEGMNFVSYYAVDNLSNEEMTKPFVIGIDAVPPEVDLLINEKRTEFHDLITIKNGVTNYIIDDKAVIRLLGLDGLKGADGTFTAGGGSGIKALYFKIGNDSVWRKYTETTITHKTYESVLDDLGNPILDDEGIPLTQLVTTTESIPNLDISLVQEDETIVQYKAMDNVGNVSPVQSKAFILRRSLPEAELVLDGPHHSFQTGVAPENIRVTSATKLVLHAVSAASSIKNVTFKIFNSDNQNEPDVQWQTLDNVKQEIRSYSEPKLDSNGNQIIIDGVPQYNTVQDVVYVPASDSVSMGVLPEEGHYILKYSIEFFAQARTLERNYSFIVDNIPPAGAVSLVLNAPITINGNLFLSGAKELSFSGLSSLTDPSGLKGLFYQIDGSEDRLFDTVFKIVTPGSHTISWRVKDSLDNSRELGQSTFNIDNNPPYVDYTLENGSSGPRLVISADDQQQAGVKRIFCSVNGSQTEQLGGSDLIVPLSAGDYNVDLGAEDNAGNQSQSINIHFTLSESGFQMTDSSLPIASVTISGPAQQEIFEGVSYPLAGPNQFISIVGHYVGGSGLDKYFISLNGTDWSECRNGIPDMSIFHEGLNLFSYKVSDHNNHESVVGTYQFIYDRISSEAVISFDKPVFKGNYSYISAGTKVSFAGEDGLPITDKVFYSLDGAAFQQFTTAILLEGVNPHNGKFLSVRYFAIDQAGNKSVLKEERICIDNEVPTLEKGYLKLTNDYNQIDLNSTVFEVSPYSSMKFDISDKFSGPANYSYSFDNGTSHLLKLSESVAFLGLSEGMHLLSVDAKDKVGNSLLWQRNISIQSLSVETTLISSGLTYRKNNILYVLSGNKYHFTTSPDTWKTYYDINNAGYLQYDGSELTIPNSGESQSISYYSIGKLGNTESVKTYSVVIDAYAPITELSVTGSGKKTYEGDLIVSKTNHFVLTARDIHSGVKRIEYQIVPLGQVVSDSAWILYTTVFRLSPLAEGKYQLYYRSVDMLDQTEDYSSINILLDNAPPVISNMTVTPETVYILETMDNSLNIGYALNEPAYITASVFGPNISGNQIISPAQFVSAGSHTINWNCYINGIPLQAGKYTVSLTAVDMSGHSTALNVYTIDFYINREGSPKIAGLKADPSIFSPNGDGVKDNAGISFNVIDAQGFGAVSLSAVVLDSLGTVIKTFAVQSGVSDGQHTLIWDGKGDDGIIVADGVYPLRLILEKSSAQTIRTINLNVDTTKPLIASASIDVNAISPYSVTGSGVNVTALLTSDLQDNTSVTIESFTISYKDSLGNTLLQNEYDGPLSTGVNHFILNGKDDLGTSLNDGLYTIGLKAYDKAGNSSEEVSFPLYIDNLRPVISQVSVSTGFRGPNTPVLISAKEKDLLDMVPVLSAKIYSSENMDFSSLVRELTLQNQPTNQYSGIWEGHNTLGEPISDGKYYYVLSGYDHAGLSARPVTGLFAWDSHAPQTILSGIGFIDANGNEIIGPNQSLSINSVDPIINNISSGFKDLTIIDNDISTLSLNSFFDFSTLNEGPHHLIYFARDLSENTEAPNTKDFQIDKTAPVTHFQINGQICTDDPHFMKFGEKISLSASDPVINGTSSGVKQTKFSWDSGVTWLVYSSNTVMWAEGQEQLLKYQSMDNIGNSEPIKTVRVVFDITPPDVPQNLSYYVCKTNVVLYWSSVTNQDLAGYNVYRNGVKINATPLISIVYIDTLKVSGLYEYKITSIDKVGNESTYSVPVLIKTGDHVKIIDPKDMDYFCHAVKIKAIIKTDNGKGLWIDVGSGQTPSTWQNIYHDNRSFKRNHEKAVFYAWNTENRNGDYLIRVRTKENNIWLENSVLVHVDNTAPITKLSVNSNILNCKETNVMIGTTLTFNATDPIVNNVASGIKVTKYHLERLDNDHGRWHENRNRDWDDICRDNDFDSYCWDNSKEKIWDGNPIYLTIPGLYVVKYYSIDNAIGYHGEWRDDHKWGRNEDHFTWDENENIGNKEHVNFKLIRVLHTPPGADVIPPVITIAGVNNGLYTSANVRPIINITDAHLKATSILREVLKTPTV